MLVATPAAPSLADRKPRVISEIRKPHVQRSPSLDDLPRLSGTLNYYCSILGIWSQRSVSVRDGCLLLYGEGRPHAPARAYASLGRHAGAETLPLLADLGCRTADQCQTLGRPRAALQHTRSDSSGAQSLGRAWSGLELRLPLRHLNLMPSSLAPRAFSLSYRQAGPDNEPVVILQALNEVEYERWVKTLAVEIMKQTPLDAIRFLDVLGIASISTPSSKSSPTVSPSALPNKVSRAENKQKKNFRARSVMQSSGPRWDRSPSSEGSTTSADFVSRDKKTINSETVLRSKKISSIGQSLPRRKLCMSDVESQSDRDEVDAGINQSFSKQNLTDTKSTTRKSREKMRRSRDIGGNGSSSEETRTIDEGIVLEERESSSERSCRRNLWPSDRSDCLDSPHSVSSYSSYELCDSPDAIDSVEEPSSQNEKMFLKPSYISREIVKSATVDSIPERIYSKNVNTSASHNNLIKKKCEKKAALEKIVQMLSVNNVHETTNENPSETDKNTRLHMPLYRAQPYNVSSAVLSKSEALTKKIKENNKILPLQILSHKSAEIHNGLTPSITIEKVNSKALIDNKSTQFWSRARSCSPTNSGNSPLRDGRGARALSVGQPPVLSVETLRVRCQDTEIYVPVKDKLALFESLCHAGRLARSSEELAAEIEKGTAPRARSLHDLTRERSPHVPVREMCKFFEKFGNSGKERKQIINNQKPLPTRRRFSENLPEIKARSRLPYVEKCENKIMDRSICGLKSYNFNTISINPDVGLNISKYRVNPKVINDLINYNNDVKMTNSVNSAKNNKLDCAPINNPEIKEAFDYGGFKQIRLGNKIITYV